MMGGGGGGGGDGKERERGARDVREVGDHGRWVGRVIIAVSSSTVTW